MSSAQEPRAVPDVSTVRRGARATRLLEVLDLPKAREDQVVRDAVGLMAAHDDKILRDYYIYLALGEEMPSDTAARWKYFQQNGREMLTKGTGTKRTSNGNSGGSSRSPRSRSRKSGQGAATEETRETSSAAQS